MMHADMGAPPYNSGLMTVRPMHEAYRSLPGTPVGIDPRGTGTMGFDVGDYFSGNPRLGPGVMRPRSPFPIDYEHDNGLARNRPYGPDQESWKEEIWRR